MTTTVQWLPSEGKKKEKKSNCHLDNTSDREWQKIAFVFLKKMLRVNLKAFVEGRL